MLLVVLRPIPVLLLLAAAAMLPCSALAETAPETPAPAAATAAPAAAETPASGRNCLGESRPRLIMRQVLGIKWGPWGIEHQLRIGGCAPLVRKSGVLFDYSFIEAGFQAHSSPIYVMPGGYIDIAPLSILQFHFQFAPVFYWPIRLNGAGYYPMDSYEQDYTETLLLPELGETALGWYLRAGTTLQLAVPIGPVQLLVSDNLMFEHWQLGEDNYYFHNRNDIPAARREWFIDNMALLLAGFPVHPNLDLRVGLNHQLTMNFGAKQMSNFFGGMAMFRFKKLGKALYDFTPLVRVGVRPQHPVREGNFTFIIAVMFSADLLAHRAHGEAPGAAPAGNSGVAGENSLQGLFARP
jgi:hypothetical protein